MSESEEERRPRPIGVADDSEDSDVERGNDTSAAASAQAGDGPAIETTGVSAPEEGTAKKPSRKMPAFSENDLVKEKGLRQIYKEFPRKCRYKGKGREAEFLRGLMVAYKEWGYQLYPGAAFEDLASRTEKLGGKARTRDLMRELRDTERDRVLEAKYGRAAVEDLRAQEATKLAAKESKTAAAQEDAAEEQEDEELASSRYMEVDGGGGAGSGAEAEAEAASAAVISEQVRQRMEVNRRLALERLRKKKEEAAAALEKENDHGTTGAAAVPQGDNNDAEVTDPMEVDDGDAGAAGDDVDDDEAALADMGAEAEARAEETIMETGADMSADAAAAAAVAATPPAPTPPAGTNGAVKTALPDKAQEEATSSEKSSERREHEAAGNDNNGASEDVADHAARGVVDRGRQREAGQSVGNGASDGDGGGGDDGANGAASDVPGASGEEDSGSGASPASPPGETAPVEPACGEERGRAQDQAAGETQNSASEAAAAMQTSETAGGSDSGDPTAGDARGDGDGAAAKASSTRRDEHATFSSPAKGKAGGGLPLSPLGNLFASTDESAEGGTAAARAPLAGLFTDENA